MRYKLVHNNYINILYVFTCLIALITDGGVSISAYTTPRGVCRMTNCNGNVMMTSYCSKQCICKWTDQKKIPGVLLYSLHGARMISNVVSDKKVLIKSFQK